MKTAFCTISTQSHLFKSLTLLESVSAVSNADLFCLVTDCQITDIESDVKFHFLSDLNSLVCSTLKKKYKNDALRWSMKPVYLKFLLDNGYDSVIYCDNDIFFYDSPHFLFEKLEEKSFLLTPHFYPSNPTKNQNWLEANFRVGLYNAGFIGVSKSGIEILDWWTNCCLYNVKKSFWRGLFDDQKYLDLVPVKFDNVEIVKHRGCNLAAWNSDEIDIIKTEKDHFLIDNYPLIFIHFAALSLEKFSLPESILYPAYLHYLNSLKLQNSNFQFSNSKWTKNGLSSYFYYLRWRFVRLFEN